MFRYNRRHFKLVWTNAECLELLCEPGCRYRQSTEFSGLSTHRKRTSTAPFSATFRHSTHRRHQHHTRAINFHRLLVLGRYSPIRPSTRHRRPRRCVLQKGAVIGFQTTVFIDCQFAQHIVPHFARLTALKAPVTIILLLNMKKQNEGRGVPLLKS